ncbi:AMP deaminase 3-like [Heterodontus francisci]|uniref:AMP deaminase 3-like n=1 Tax=Heterodontus francisci TaxID=7792 RepID=UPI00355AFB41
MSEMDYHHIIVTDDTAAGVASSELKPILQKLLTALEIREKYMHRSLQRFPRNTAQILRSVNGQRWTEQEDVQPDFTCYPADMSQALSEEGIPADLPSRLEMRNGILTLLDCAGNLYTPESLRYPDHSEYTEDLKTVLQIISNGPLKTYCNMRLKILNSKFHLHLLVNEKKEFVDLQAASHSDFYNVGKVDTHIHAAACMNQNMLLQFIRKTYKRDSERVVRENGGKKLTLRELFQCLNLNPDNMDIDALNVHADRETFQRFDRFNEKYNPVGANELRILYLKTNNFIRGEYFAALVKEFVVSLDDASNQFAELRLSIYGSGPNEWKDLADWFFDHKVCSPKVRWMIQVPRIYNVFHKLNKVKSFEEMLDNLFRPIFEATLCPQKNKSLHLFLKYVTAFDSVDDESKTDEGFFPQLPLPANWTSKKNPPYSYYQYYMYSNITVLNHLRRERGMNTFLYRPHCGEAGSHTHLVDGFLTADNISHGLRLKKDPALQYLYYLAQIPIAMSPLSNNSLFLEYGQSPFYQLFQSGLVVSLSTDDPLLFHFTKEALIEEYAVAAQFWKLTTCDMCEIARNSVKQSGLSHQEKQTFLGTNYLKDGPEGNDMQRSNVSQIRIAFRFETWNHELKILVQAGKP